MLSLGLFQPWNSTSSAFQDLNPNTREKGETKPQCEFFSCAGVRYGTVGTAQPFSDPVCIGEAQSAPRSLSPIRHAEAVEAEKISGLFIVPE